MQYVKLGKTDLKVSRLALGGLFISEYGADFKESEAAVHHALECGINYIDTAPSYFNSEEVLGKILQNTEKPFILSTKFSGDPKPFNPQLKCCLYQAIENSLNRLKRDHIDIMYIHEADRPQQFDWWTTPQDLNHPEEYYGPVLDVLRELKKDGTIRYSGIGGTTAYEIVPIIKTGLFDVILSAFNYSILWREAEIEILPAAKELGMGIVLGSPLQQGAFSARFDDVVQMRPAWLSPARREQFMKLYALCDELDINVVEMAMRFVFSNIDVHCVLTGSKNTHEVDSNIAAFEKGPLPEDVVKRLGEIYQIAPYRPFEEPFTLPFTRPYKGPGCV